MSRLLTGLTALILALIAGAGPLAGTAAAGSIPMRSDAIAAYSVQSGWNAWLGARDDQTTTDSGSIVPSLDRPVPASPDASIGHVVPGTSVATASLSGAARLWFDPPVSSGLLAATSTGVRAPPRA